MPASRVVLVLLALLAFAGCAPVDSDEALPDGAARGEMPVAQSGSFEVELRSGSAAPRIFDATSLSWDAGRLELVLEGTSQRDMDALQANPPSSAVITHLDEDGLPVLESVHTGIAVLGRPQVVQLPSGIFRVELGYETFSLTTP